MAQQFIKIFDDTVLKQSVNQGYEIQRTNSRLGKFTMGELAFTRDTARLFVGNSTTLDKDKDSTEVIGGSLAGNKYLGIIDSKPLIHWSVDNTDKTSSYLPLSYTEDTTITYEEVVNGTTTTKTQTEKALLIEGSKFRTDKNKGWSKSATYNEKYDAYNGDYIYDVYNNAIILFDKNIKPISITEDKNWKIDKTTNTQQFVKEGTTKDYYPEDGVDNSKQRTRIHNVTPSTEEVNTSKESIVGNPDYPIYGDGYVVFRLLEPDNITIGYKDKTYNQGTGEEEDNNYSHNYLELKSIPIDLITDLFDETFISTEGDADEKHLTFVAKELGIEKITSDTLSLPNSITFRDGSANGTKLTFNVSTTLPESNNDNKLFVMNENENGYNVYQCSFPSITITFNKKSITKQLEPNKSVVFDISETNITGNLYNVSDAFIINEEIYEEEESNDVKKINIDGYEVYYNGSIDGIPSIIFKKENDWYSYDSSSNNFSEITLSSNVEKIDIDGYDVYHYYGGDKTIPPIIFKKNDTWYSYDSSNKFSEITLYSDVTSIDITGYEVYYNGDDETQSIIFKKNDTWYSYDSSDGFVEITETSDVTLIDITGYDVYHYYGVDETIPPIIFKKDNKWYSYDSPEGFTEIAYTEQEKTEITDFQYSGNCIFDSSGLKIAIEHVPSIDYNNKKLNYETEGSLFVLYDSAGEEANYSMTSNDTTNFEANFEHPYVSTGVNYLKEPQPLAWGGGNKKITLDSNATTTPVQEIETTSDDVKTYFVYKHTDNQSQIFIDEDGNQYTFDEENKTYTQIENINLDELTTVYKTSTNEKGYEIHTYKGNYIYLDTINSIWYTNDTKSWAQFFLHPFVICPIQKYKSSDEISSINYDEFSSINTKIDVDEITGFDWSITNEKVWSHKLFKYIPDENIEEQEIIFKKGEYWYSYNNSSKEFVDISNTIKDSDVEDEIDITGYEVYHYNGSIDGIPSIIFKKENDWYSYDSSSNEFLVITGIQSDYATLIDITGYEVYEYSGYERENIENTNKNYEKLMSTLSNDYLGIRIPDHATSIICEVHMLPLDGAEGSCLITSNADYRSYNGNRPNDTEFRLFLDGDFDDPFTNKNELNGYKYITSAKSSSYSITQFELPLYRDSNSMKFFSFHINTSNSKYIIRAVGYKA